MCDAADHRGRRSRRFHQQLHPPRPPQHPLRPCRRRRRRHLRLPRLRRRRRRRQRARPRPRRLPYPRRCPRTECPLRLQPIRLDNRKTASCSGGRGVPAAAFARTSRCLRAPATERSLWRHGRAGPSVRPSQSRKSAPGCRTAVRSPRLTRTASWASGPRTLSAWHRVTSRASSCVAASSSRPSPGQASRAACRRRRSTAPAQCCVTPLRLAPFNRGRSPSRCATDHETCAASAEGTARRAPSPTATTPL
mmetsp:Transcript_11805/g.37461  ORF Transcript_11805/g.37461 Transcript_11805/m.37461 type:complete len:250 (+) Transcript_11805:487-1236(+)